MTKLVPFIGEEYLVRDKESKSQSLDNAFDQLEQLISEDFDELDDWDDDISQFDSSSAEPGNEPASSTKQLAAATRTAPYQLIPIDDGDGLQLALSGQVDFFSREQIYHLIHDIRGGKTKHYDIDLKDCPLITVTGISLLLLLKEATGERKVEITISNCQPKVYQALSWAGMDKHFLVAPL
jgi:anti-anti-sigma regulatory factor